nr:hypothetical protein Iba_chr04cCG12930 [Ipomoea batatas]
MVVASSGSSSVISSIIELHCFPANYYVCDCAESSGSPTGISVPTRPPRSILTSLKSTVVQMEKVLLEDKKLLQSFEADDVDPDFAPTR